MIRTKPVYIARQTFDSNNNIILDDYGNVLYSKPKRFNWNVQPLSLQTDIAQYGSKAVGMQQVVLDYDKYFGIFKEGDLAYLDYNLPNDEDINGINANYRITSIANQNKYIVIKFEKLPAK